MRAVEAAVKIAVLADEQVAEDGSSAELFANEEGIFRRMAGLQTVNAEWSIKSKELGFRHKYHVDLSDLV